MFAPFLILALTFSHFMGRALGKCNNPIIRKEWRALSDEEKRSYLDAVNCLLEKPALIPSYINRYHDLVATHILQYSYIHFVGQFFPWHRYFVAVYERMLRDECQYDGAQPYWDWNLDFDDLVSSPVLDGELGFGGNGPYIPWNDTTVPEIPGRTGGGCVEDGAFVNMTVHFGPNSNLQDNPRCLKRDLSPWLASSSLGWNMTKSAMAEATFGGFWRNMDGGPTWMGDPTGQHPAGHFSVGGNFGEMGDPYNSPADPIFFMHHTNLDRAWWSWQNASLESRLYDISGPVIWQDYNNTQGGNVTLGYELGVGPSARNVTIADVMDIQGGTLCYIYETLYQGS